MEHGLLMKAGGASALLAIPSVLLAGIFIALFFQGKGDRYGPLNDIFSALTLLLLILPALALDRTTSGQAGSWFGILTGLAVLGMVFAALCTILLVLGRINLNTSFITGGVGITPVLAWIAAQAYTGMRFQLPSPAIGWLALALLMLVGLEVLAYVLGRKVELWIVSVSFGGALVAYFAAVGSLLLRRS